MKRYAATDPYVIREDDEGYLVQYDDVMALLGMIDHIDYKDLLKKYVTHIIYNMGFDFLKYRTKYPGHIVFKDYEWNELIKISNEIMEER